MDCSACAKCFLIFQVPAAPRILPARPAPPVDEAADGREEDREDHADRDEDNADPPAVSAAKKKVILALHSRLAELMPDAFHYKETNLPYWESASETPFPLLRVDPDLEGTWLRPPLSHPDDEYGHWIPDDKMKLPPAMTRLVPKGSDRQTLKRPSYYHVSDESLKDMLEAPTRDKIFLPPNMFDRNSVSVKSSPLTLLDSHLRTSLLEFYTTESYMRILVELTNCAAGTSTTVSPSEAVSLMPEVARQAAQSHARSDQSLSAAYVGTTVALRDYVLNTFTVPPRSIDYLRGGDFSTKSLFGPIPEHFATLLDSAQGDMYRCTSYTGTSSATTTTSTRTSFATSMPRKRAAPSRRYHAPKRTPPPVSNPPRGRGRGFRRRSAGRRSRLGRS